VRGRRCDHGVGEDGRGDRADRHPAQRPRAGFADSCNSPATISTPVNATSAIGSRRSTSDVQSARRRGRSNSSACRCARAREPECRERQLGRACRRSRAGRTRSVPASFGPSRGRTAVRSQPTPISSAVRPLMWPVWRSPPVGVARHEERREHGHDEQVEQDRPSPRGSLRRRRTRAARSAASRRRWRVAASAVGARGERHEQADDRQYDRRQASA